MERTLTPACAASSPTCSMPCPLVSRWSPGVYYPDTNVRVKGGPRAPAQRRRPRQTSERSAARLLARRLALVHEPEPRRGLPLSRARERVQPLVRERRLPVGQRLVAEAQRPQQLHDLAAPLGRRVAPQLREPLAPVVALLQRA